VFIGTLPHVIHQDTGDFSAHISLMFPFVILLIGAGITEVTGYWKNGKSVTVFAVIGLLYAVSLTGFISQYFLQYPLLGTADFPVRILSRYIKLSESPGRKIIVYSSRSADLLKKFMFYTDYLNRRTLSNAKGVRSPAVFAPDGISFRSCDNNKVMPAPDTVIMIDRACDYKPISAVLRISRLSDGGGEYSIINDRLCNPEILQHYPSGVSLHDLAAEQLTTDRFCRLYINN
jgi:hypothetical protein